MKKIYGFAALAAAMTLASCSNEDQPKVIDENGTTLGYIAVSIANDDDTRADDLRKPDTNEESKVSSATFVFFNGNNYVTSHTVTLGENGSIDNDFIDGTGDIDRNAVVVAVKPKGDFTSTPNKMVTILNMPSGFAVNKTLPELLASTQDFKTNLTTAGGTFVMTNSVYQAGTPAATVDVTDITDKLYDSPQLARANKVDVYVERVVARADIKSNSLGDAVNLDKNEYTITYIDDNGDTQTVVPTVQINGVSYVNYAKTSRLVKSIDFGTNAPSWSWNDANNHRSHWAVGSASAAADFGSIAHSSVTTVPSQTYLQENTSSTNPTSVVVAATLLDKPNGNPLKLVRFMSGGTYMLEQGAKNIIRQTLVDKYGYKVGNEVLSLPANFFTWKEGGVKGTTAYDCVGYLQLDESEESPAADAELMYKDADEWKALDATHKTALNNELKAMTCLVWNNGACYYYKEIKNPDNAKGIIRNHVYELSLTSLKGLGVPVVNPGKDIIPEDIPTPDASNDWYLGVSINIVKWAKVAQTVDFNN